MPPDTRHWLRKGPAQDQPLKARSVLSSGVSGQDILAALVERQLRRMTVARRLARHPDRPDAVDVLIADVREKQAQQQEVERQQRLKDFEARDLGRLTALKAKYESAGEGATTMKRTKD